MKNLVVLAQFDGRTLIVSFAMELPVHQDKNHYSYQNGARVICDLSVY